MKGSSHPANDSSTRLSSRVEGSGIKSLGLILAMNCYYWLAKAFPDFQDMAREELALTRYLDQLSNPQVSFGIKQRSHKTIHEAVSSTVELETYLLKSASCNIRQVTQKEPGEEPLLQRFSPP